MRLQQQSGSTLPATEGNEISIYSGELTPRAVIENVARIKMAFPSLPAGFYDILSERIKENKFCDDRLVDAVAHVIDNCRYPNPSVADFISFDRTLKFKTWHEMTKEDCWSTYLPVKFPDRPKVVWIHANDIANHGLGKYLVDNQTK